MAWVVYTYSVYEAAAGCFREITVLCSLHPDGMLRAPRLRARFPYRRFVRFVRLIVSIEGGNHASILPPGVADLGRNCFEAARCPLSVVLPNTITRIDYRAFSGAMFVTHITLPEGLEEIGESAFSSCDGLRSLVVPQTVRRIEDSAFETCRNLTSITLPDELDHFGSHVFEGCSRLRSMRFPRGPTTVGEFTFRDCTALSSVTLPEGVTRTEECAFQNCPALFSIVLPRSCLELGEYTFEGCTGLELIVGDPAFRAILFDNGTDAFVPGDRETIVDGCPLMNKADFVSPHTPAAVAAARMLEYWHPTLHKRCSEDRREWVRAVLLILTRRLRLPHVVAVVVVTLIKRAELGR